MKALNERQKEYARRRAKGEGRAKAYKGAGYCPNGTDKTANDNACKIERDTALLQQIERYKKQAEQGAIMDRAQRQALLTDMAYDTDASRADRLRAVDLLNRMSGDYDDRLTVTGSHAISIEDTRREAWDALNAE